MPSTSSLHLPAIPLGSRRASSKCRKAGSVIAWLVQALADVRRSSIDREVADLIERSGGKFTDDLERSIEQRLFDRP